MPIQLTGYNIDTLCWGNTWSIENEDLLAELVAKVLIGYQHHVAKILRGVNVGDTLNFGKQALNDAIKKLTVPADGDPSHRDGLIFQILSWIAANKSAGNNSLIARPHLIPAQKGFDGIQVKISTETGDIESVIIFEDKATTSPRKTIRDKVWPEFSTFEEGQRESELMQETVALLSTQPALVPDIEAAIGKLIWGKVRSYRVAITAEPNHLTNEGLKSLFKDYEKIISCDSNIKRQGEVIHIPELRKWLNEFSLKVIVILNTSGFTNV